MRRYGIARAINRPYATVHDWLVRAFRPGVSGRYDEMRIGSKCRLDVGQLASLKADLIAGLRECGFETDVWACRIAAGHAGRTYGVEYLRNTAPNLFTFVNHPGMEPTNNESERVLRSVLTRRKMRYRLASTPRLLRQGGYPVFITANVITVKLCKYVVWSCTTYSRTKL